MPTANVALIQRNTFLPIQMVLINIAAAWDTIAHVHLQGSRAMIYIPQLSAEET